jgi:uncharacterized protein
MPRVVHFEIPIDDPDRAIKFYRNVFGWDISKWEGPSDYWLVDTGPDGEIGINGALMRREGGFTNTTNTVGVDSLDEAVAKVEANGGKIILPKMAVPGIGWIAYAQDSEGNNFGMMQSDAAAR